MPYSPSYDAASRVHLIKSPSLAVPTPATFPTDVHPLPPDLQAYFVYPFSLESYVLSANSPTAKTIDELHARHDSFLRWRDEEKKRRERERLRRVAPGWSGETAVLQPTKRASVLASTLGPTADGDSGGDSDRSPSAELDPMAQLVEHLSKLEADTPATSQAAGSGPAAAQSGS
ncbi:unnamed protein product [Parajaminaea phylloscopi]